VTGKVKHDFIAARDLRLELAQRGLHQFLREVLL
jgi:hypothetical protein